MKISVIIPTYQPKEYLWQCLDSLSNQDFPKSDFEIIIVLNGCCEPWLSQIKDFISSRKANWVVLQTDEGGVSNARNTGLDIAKGEYVSFLDDDDYVSPNYLSLLYEAVAPDCIAVARPVAFYDNTGVIWKEYPITLLYEKNAYRKVVPPSKARRYFSGPCMKLIPMSFIQDRRFNPKFRIGEDGLFNYLISDNIKKVSFASPDAVYYRRYREGSALMTKRSRIEKLRNNSLLFKEELKIYLSNPLKYSLRVLMRNFIGLCWSIIN